TVLTAKRHNICGNPPDVIDTRMQRSLPCGKLEWDVNPCLARRLRLRVHHRQPQEHTENCNHSINFVFHRTSFTTKRDSREETGSKKFEPEKAAHPPAT